MALTKISTGMLKQDAASSDLNIDAGTLYIDVSNNRVGIANTSPAAPLHVSATDAEIRLQHTGNSYFQRIFTDSSNNLKFGTGPNGTERMRIESSGNLLVGKISSSFTTAGVELAQGGTAGKVQIQRSSSPLTLANLTDDGAILNFYKGTSSVGSISILSSRIAIGTGDTGVFFDSTRDCLSPFSITTNDGRGSAIDIGRTAVKFKDLHLSGTAHVPSGVEVINSGNLIKHDYNDLGTYVQQVRSYNDRALILSTKSQDNNNYISFETQDTDRMRISSEGTVGIGVTPSDLNSATYKLQLYAPTQCFMSFGNSTTGSGNLNGLVIGNDANGADIYQRENQYLRFHTNDIERMRLNASGNLSLNSNGDLTSIDGVQPSMQIGNSGTESAGVALENQHRGWVTYLTSAAGKFSIWDSTSNNDRLTIDTNGDIGFGETDPDLSLHIKRSGDAGIVLENTGAGQTMRIDQNSIRTTTSSQINIFAGNQSNQLYLSGTVERVGINTSTLNADGLTIGTASNGNCELDLSNTSGTRFRFTSQSTSLLQIYNVNNSSNKLVLGNGSDFGGAFGSTNIQTIGGGYGALTITGSSGGGINMGPNSGTAYGQLYADSSKTRLRTIGNEEMWVSTAGRREVMYPEGHKSQTTSFGSITGYYHHLGWLDGTSSDFTHIKTSISRYDYAMIKFIYEGYGYSSTNISGSLTVYTYGPQSTPYQPTIVNGGSSTSYGFYTCYYSSDNYLVIVLQLIANGYAGGQLWSQSNDQHGNEEVSILAYTGSGNSTGAY